MFRCHASARAATAFNAGHARFRWSFFGSPPVLALYPASSPAAAFAETVLHDARPGEILDATLYIGRTITALRVCRPLRLACLHSHALQALGLHARNLLDSIDDHPQTIDLCGPGGADWAIAAAALAGIWLQPPG